MTLQTKPLDKREKLKKLREFHQSELDKLGLPNAFFVPKMAYTPYGKSEKHISFFLSEINRGEDIYVEFCSKELEPEDPERRLYKWRFNPHFQAEYDTTEPNPDTGHVRYLIPVGELVVIKINNPGGKISESEVSIANQEFSLTDPDTDIPYNQMTLRDYAAIHLKLPVSRKEWLNKIIKGDM